MIKDYSEQIMSEWFLSLKFASNATILQQPMFIIIAIEQFQYCF